MAKTLLRGMWVASADELKTQIEVLRYSLPELARVTAEGEFNHALHVAVLLVAMLRGKVSLTPPLGTPCSTTIARRLTR